MTHDPSRDGGDQGQEARPQGPGRRLREQREALGLPLVQAAQDLRILRSVLQALEEDRYEVLEAPIFVRGHLKNYARLLDLPPEEIVDAYERSRPPQQAPELHLDTERGPAMSEGTSGWVITVAWLLILSMLVLGGLWWYAGPHREPLVATTAGEEREPSVSPPVADGDENMPETDSLVDEGDPEGLELLQPLNLTEGSEADPAQASDEAVGDPARADDEASVDEEQRAVREARADPDPRDEAQAETTLIDDVDPAERRALVLSLSDDSWLEVHDSDNRQLYYGLAVEGERIDLVGRAPINLFMGNAPAVSISVDGEDLDFGARVRRDNTARVTIAPAND